LSGISPGIQSFRIRDNCWEKS